MREPIRVAHVMGKMVGGGVEQVVMNYYRHIDRSHVQFDFLVDSDSTLVPRDEIESLGGRVFVIPPYQQALRYQRELTGLFREEAWPIVHSHVNALSVFPLRAAKRAGIPVRIAHSHSTTGRGENARKAMKLALRHFSRVYPTDLFACGRYAGEWLFGRGAEFTVMTNAIELASFKFDPVVRKEVRAELGIPEGTFLVGHIARFVTQKNHAFLLRVFARLKDMFPGSRLVMVGEGPLEGETKRLAQELGLGDSATFLGRRKDAARLYSAFDAFALPSFYEGLCVVGVEAQAAGLPCLFSDAVTREVGLSSAARFLPLDEEGWVSALAELAGAGSLSREAPEGVSEYDIDGAARRLEAWYLGRVAEIQRG